MKAAESSSTPYISFVVGARNDTHGGNFLNRMQVFVDTLIDQCWRHELNAELLIVEWNPPPGRKPLAEALRWPESSSHCSIRIIRVPKALHDRFENSDQLPLHQFIAKNVGIRRARGDMVVATNADIIFSDDLMDFLARGYHDHEHFYRIDRYDVAGEPPTQATTSDQLLFCANNVIRIHRRTATEIVETGASHRTYHTLGLLQAVQWSFPVGFLAFLILSLLDRLPKGSTRSLIKHLSKGERFGFGHLQACWQGYRHIVIGARLSLMVRRRFGCPHTNASGDFTMMSKRKWMELGGYPEYPGFPRHVDGLLLYRACLHGLSETALREPARVYHMEHEDGSGFEEYVSGRIEERLKQKGVPFISSEQLMDRILDMDKEKPAFPKNSAQWGLDDEPLEERVVVTGSS